MKSPQISDFEPTPEQKVIIIDKVDAQESALIISGPGTGKSRTAIEAARRVISTLGKESLRQVLFLSFSNAAIQRLAQTAGIQFAKPERRRLRFMTYHSCAAEILVYYGRFLGLPLKVRVIDRLEERLIAFESGWDDGSVNYDDQLFELARKKGYLAFNVLIPLAVRILNTSSKLREIIGRNYPLIIVDEFQDTSELQWNLLRALGDKSQVLAFADPNQIIYSSIHGATEARLKEFKSWKGVEENTFSRKNFRCDNTEILMFADCLLTGKAYAVQKGLGIQVYKLNNRDQLRAYLALIWKSIQEKIGTNQTIGFLAPSNRLVEEIAVALRNPPTSSKVQFPVYARMACDEAAHDAVLLALAALRDLAANPGKELCTKAAIAILAMNLSWNNRIKMKHEAIEKVSARLESISPGDGSPFGTLLELLRSSHDIKAYVHNFAEALIAQQEFAVTGKRIKAHGRLVTERIAPTDQQLLLFDNIRNTRKPKGLYGYDAWEGKTHILNYHKAKGREFDFVAMVVDPRQESTKAILEEKRRLYHVCATRTKKWLGVIYFGNDLGSVLGPVLKPA